MTALQLLPILAGLFSGAALALNVIVFCFGHRFIRLGMPQEDLSTLRLGCVGVLLAAVVILLYSLERTT